MRRPPPPLLPLVLPRVPTEFARQPDFAAQETGPERFAERTRGSWMASGRSEVLAVPPTSASITPGRR